MQLQKDLHKSDSLSLDTLIQIYFFNRMTPSHDRTLAPPSDYTIWLVINIKKDIVHYYTLWYPKLLQLHSFQYFTTFLKYSYVRMSVFTEHKWHPSATSTSISTTDV